MAARVVFSGIQPTGIPHASCDVETIQTTAKAHRLIVPGQLGNYLGALKNWVALQNGAHHKNDKLYFSIVGLHAITLPQDPASLRRESSDMLAALLAIGLDPERATIFRQEQVPQHAELAWYLNCLAPFGRLQRMTTWKSRLATVRNANSESEVDESLLHLGLFAYPVLQAADVLLYNTTEVPVGEDQGQHIELTRDLATIFNKQYKSKTFTLPKHVYTPQARVLNLRDPYSKMSKSNPDPRTRIMLTDPPDLARSKLKSAVTDSRSDISYDPAARPGVSNLLGILSGLTDTSVEECVARLEGKTMRGLKHAVGDALEPLLNQFQGEFGRLKADEAYLKEIERKGRAKAMEQAEAKMQEVRRTVGLDYA